MLFIWTEVENISYYWGNHLKAVLFVCFSIIKNYCTSENKSKIKLIIFNPKIALIQSIQWWIVESHFYVVLCWLVAAATQSSEPATDFVSSVKRNDRLSNDFQPLKLCVCQPASLQVILGAHMLACTWCTRHSRRRQRQNAGCDGGKDVTHWGKSMHE